MKRPLLRALDRAGLLLPVYRAYEGLRALAARPADGEPPADGLPVPPPRLRVRVAGTPDLAWFLESGRLAAESIRAAAARAGLPLERAASILDFGCGCGRVVRHWAHLDGTALAGSDASRAAVEWCRANLPFARFEINALAPPVRFGDAEFDLVYALSVFTHLPEQRQQEWIDELRRVLRPGGLLLLSTHGESYLGRLDPAERARFQRGELVVRWPSAAGSNLCAAFHPPSYVRERLARGLEPVEFVPEGARGNPDQDLHVLRRPG